MDNNKKEFFKDLAKLQIDGLKTLIEKHFPDSTEKQAWVLTLNPTYKILEALTDADPNNKDQLIAIMKEHTSQNVIPFASNEFVKVLDRITDAKLRALVEVISKIPFAVGEIYTDSNSKNNDQLRTYLEEWAESPENQNILLNQVLQPLLEKLFKRNAWLGNFIISTINMRLSGMNIDINKDGK